MEHRIEITDTKNNKTRVYNGVLMEETINMSPRGMEIVLRFYDTARFRDLTKKRTQHIEEVSNQNDNEEILL